MWYLWKILALHSYFVISWWNKFSNVMSMKNTSFFMHISLLVFQTWYLWKMLAFEDIFLYYMTGSCFSVVMFVENISLWRHIFQVHRRKIFSDVNFVEKVSLWCIIFLLLQRNKTFIVMFVENVGFACTFCNFIMKQVFRFDVYKRY